MEYDCSLNKHLCISHVKLKASRRKFSTKGSYGIRPWLGGWGGFLDWHLCTSFGYHPKHRWQAWLGKLKKKKKKTFQAGCAIKLERSSKTLRKCSNSPASRLAADFISGKCVFNLGLSNPALVSVRVELEKFGGRRKSSLWTSLKITSVFHHRGLQLLVDAAVLSLHNIRGQWLYIKHQSHFHIKQNPLKSIWEWGGGDLSS